MTAGPDTRLVDLFQAVIDVPPDERAAWLAARCDDAALSQRVRELLAEHDAADDPELERPVAALRGIADGLWVAPLPVGTQVGRFTLGRVIATGGMGTVYEAEQASPRRKVALKVLSAGLAPGARRRFEYESQILAHLQHPGIAQVFDSGTLQLSDRTIPWFAMEFVASAQTIKRFCAERPRDARLALFTEACAAVHHGHQLGIIHRDLKPANLLVDSRGHVKVIDFGVAKSTDADLGMATLQTHAGQLVGTLGYMSPEQTLGTDTGDTLDTRSDVYSLGVVLFELLTNVMPYDLEGHSIMASVRIVTEREPDRQALARANVPADLCTIVLKALAKDRGQRYDSTAALSADVTRYLRREPIAARPPSAWYQFSRFAQRNRLLVGTAAVLVLSLILGSLGIFGFYLQASEARDEAQQALEDSRVVENLLARMLYDANPWTGGGASTTSSVDGVKRASDFIDKARPKPSVEARLRAILGEAQLRLADNPSAERHMKRAAELYEQLEGGANDRTLSLRTGVVMAVMRQGRLDDAERLARELRADHARVLGERNPKMLRAENALGLVLQQRHRAKDALVVFERGLRLPRAEGLAHEKLRATTENNLALALQVLGRYAEAETMLRRVVQFRKTRLSPTHPTVFNALTNLGLVVFKQGKLEDALTIFEDVLVQQQEILPRDHPKTLFTMSGLATVLRQLGRLPRAEQLATATYEARVRVSGADNPETLGAMSNLAVARMTLARTVAAPRNAELLRSAEKLFVSCIAGYDRIPHAPHARHATACGNYGDLLFGQKRLQAARESYLRAVEVLAAGRLRDRWEHPYFRAAGAFMDAHLGRADAAKPVLEECHEKLVTLVGAEHTRTAAVARWLAACR